MFAMYTMTYEFMLPTHDYFTVQCIRYMCRCRVHFADVFQNAGGDYVCIVSSTQRQVCVGVWRVTGGGVELVTGVTPDVKDLISYCICQDKLIALGMLLLLRLIHYLVTTVLIWWIHSQ